MCDFLSALPFLLVWAGTIAAAVSWGLDVAPLWKRGSRWRSFGALIACLACASPTLEAIAFAVWLNRFRP